MRARYLAVIFSALVTVAAFGQAVPAGTIFVYAGIAAPDGYLVCDGSVYKSNQYHSLSAVLQKMFCGGGCASGEFRVPDLRGRVVLGSGTGAGLSARAFGEALGEEAHKLTVPEMPSHTHHYGRATTINMGGPGAELTRAQDMPRPEIYTDPTGGDQPHNNMQPYIALTYIIKR
jgi:microcystin-dependent protein